MLKEEYREYLEAESDHDIVQIADALGDMVYIIYGTALAYGIDLEAVMREIHRSNMTKIPDDGKPVVREDGKILKPATYLPPDIKTILGA